MFDIKDLWFLCYQATSKKNRDFLPPHCIYLGSSQLYWHSYIRSLLPSHFHFHLTTFTHLPCIKNKAELCAATLYWHSYIRSLLPSHFHFHLTTFTHLTPILRTKPDYQQQHCNRVILCSQFVPKNQKSRTCIKKTTGLCATIQCNRPILCSQFVPRNQKSNNRFKPMHIVATLHRNIVATPIMLLSSSSTCSMYIPT